MKQTGLLCLLKTDKPSVRDAAPGGGGGWRVSLCMQSAASPSLGITAAPLYELGLVQPPHRMQDGAPPFVWEAMVAQGWRASVG